MEATHRCAGCGKTFTEAELPADWRAVLHNCRPGRDVVQCLLGPTARIVPLERDR